MGKHEARVEALESQLQHGALPGGIVFACERDLMSRYGIQPTGRDPKVLGHYHLCKSNRGGVAATYFSESDMALL